MKMELALLAAVAAAITMSLAGCSTGIDSAQHSTSSVTPTTASTSPAQISPDPPAVWPDSPMCIVAATSALKLRLSKVWAPPPSAGIDSFVAHDAPDDAGWMFTEERGRHFAGVSLWNIKTGEHRRVHKFADPQSYQAGGSFDGRYLLWGESHSMETASYVSIYSVSSGGIGAWVQGVGPGVLAL